MVVMEIQLKKDRSGLSAEFVEGLDGVSQNNAGNNIVRVILDGFELAEGEVLRIAYATTDNEHDVETENVGFTLMTWNSATGDYEILLDQIVLRKRGEWLLDLQIASEWNETANDYSMKLHLNEKLSFTVKNALYDATGIYPNSGDISALYAEARSIIKAGGVTAKIVTGGYYNADTDSLVLVLQTGKEISLPIGDFGSDLVFSKEKGVANGVPTLGENAKIPTEQIPGLPYIKSERGIAKGPILISNTGSVHQSLLSTEGFEVGAGVSGEGEIVNKSWYANGFILRTISLEEDEKQTTKDIVIVLPEKDCELATVEELASTLNQALQKAAQYTDKEIATFDFIKVVSTLPEEGLPNRFYLVPKENADDNDFFDEYIWVNKGTDEDPEYVWEYQGTKKVEVDLTDCVKFTDYATADKAGVIKFDIEKGFTVDNNGVAILYQASEYDIEKKNNVYRPITSFRLDHAVKVGVTTNTETLTDDTTDEDGNVVKGEKTKACEWLGAVKAFDGSQETGTSRFTIYGQNLGEQKNIPYSQQPTEFAIAQYSSGGNLKVATPRNETDAVNKGYVDDNFVVKGTVTVQSVYTQTTKGEIQTIALAGAASGAIFGAIPRYMNPIYDGADTAPANMGSLVCAEPTKLYHAANKKYVDEGFVPQVHYNTTDGGIRGYIYCVDSTNTQTSKVLAIQGFADSVPLRNATGNFYVGTPRLDLECTNKAYVDANKGTKLYLHTINFPDASENLYMISTDANKFATLLEIINTFDTNSCIRFYSSSNGGMLLGNIMFTDDNGDGTYTLCGGNGNTFTIGTAPFTNFEDTVTAL